LNRLPSDYTIFTVSRTLDAALPPNITHFEADITQANLDSIPFPDRIDGLVYCPGSIQLKPFKMLNLDTFEEEMNLNFFNLVRVTKHLIGRMNAGGSIVYFSTVAASLGMPFHTSIAAAKGAIEGFARSLAAEYAPEVRVNVIAPSLVDTPLASRLLSNDRKKEMMAERHPLKKVGRPGDIASMAAFLLGNDSDWMTGQVIGIDGGMSTLNVN
jgi:NAD(P)-dependent dehydrogenase (short-subunit alcohol dehydrogenase family)